MSDEPKKDRPTFFVHLCGEFEEALTSSLWEMYKTDGTPNVKSNGSEAVRSDAGLGAASFIDYQQRVGAPLTFFAQIACDAYAAAATRDDVSHRDAMRVALQAVEDAMRHEAPNATLCGERSEFAPAKG